MVFQKRSHNIVEVEEGQPTFVRLAACAESNFKPSSNTMPHLHEPASSVSYSTYHKPNFITTLVKNNPVVQERRLPSVIDQE